MMEKRKIIYSGGFLFFLSLGLAAYINSSFLTSFVGEKFVGVVFALASLTAVAALLIAPKIFRRIGGYKFLVLIAVLDALSFFTIAILEDTWAVILVFIIGFSLNTLIMFSLDEILKIFSTDSKTGEIRGTYLSLSNLSWIVAQLAIALFLGNFSFRVIYLSSFVVMILFSAICLYRLKNIPDPKYDTARSLSYVKKFFQHGNLRLAYKLNFLVQFFYSWMLIYTPIYLYSHLGFSWKEIGFIFMIMLIPFLIIPIRMGKYADKIGERKMLMFGFIVMGFFSLSLFFAGVHSVILWAFLLFCTRVGAATTEAMSDTYFFKHIRPENEEFVGVYRSAMPVADIVGPLLAFLLLLVLPSLNFLYIILSAIMFSGIHLASKIKKSDI